MFMKSFTLKMWKNYSWEMAMTSSRELDVLVAIHVFGIEVQKDQITRGMFADRLPDDLWEYFMGTTNDKVKLYSTEIAAAWQIWEKFKPYIFPNFPFEGNLHVSDGFCEDFGCGKKCVTVDGFDVPLALCIFALKAVGVGV